MKDVTSEFYLDTRNWGIFRLKDGVAFGENLGESGTKHVFEHEGYILVLSSDSRHGTAGLDIFDIGGELLLTIWKQNCNDKFGGDGVYREGKDFFERTYLNQARMLYQCATLL